MSVKIYDGLRMVGRNNVFDAAFETRAVLETAFFAEMDHALKALGDDAPENYAAIHRRIVQLDRQSTWTFDPLDIAYTAILLRGREWPLLVVTGEKAGRYTEALLGAGIAERYGYWDDVDPEEGLTQRQWDLRRQDWGRALSLPGRPDFDRTPTEAGLVISWPGPWPIYLHLHPPKNASDD